MLICFFFFEKGIGGGFSYISKKYNKANNKHLKSDVPKQIIYLDANNLYGYGMLKVPPKDGLKWIDPKDFDMNKYTKNSSKDF